MRKFIRLKSFNLNKDFLIPVEAITYVGNCSVDSCDVGVWVRWYNKDKEFPVLNTFEEIESKLKGE